MVGNTTGNDDFPVGEKPTEKFKNPTGKLFLSVNRQKNTDMKRIAIHEAQEIRISNTIMSCC